ncbi:MAG: LysM peptidoglycan-binding domain-containing protein [Bacteroidetes bacterium]|nr:LysM peptidoglycan-binding domain-containing protein [Bacteroidota bacterium]
MKYFMTLMILLGVVAASAFAQEEKIKKEDWQNQMTGLTTQESDLARQIDSLKKSTSSAKDESAKLDQESEAIWNEIYAAVGTDKAGVDAYKKQLTDFEAVLNERAKMSDEQLSKMGKDLDSLKVAASGFKKDKRYALTEIYNKVNDLVNRAEQLIQRGKNYTPPKPKHDSYTVNSGDYLWRISSKKEVYSDPFQWMKIYSANREQIKNPDLIYPAQTFLIPRSQEANEYWVERGDYLKGIAQKVYGSPADWVKIYNANKSILGEDSNTIYPHTILIIPK